MVAKINRASETKSRSLTPSILFPADCAKPSSAAISQGIELVIVHGGGPQIDAALVSAGIKSESIGGFRVTTPEIFEIVQSVLAGEVCASVVSNLRKSGVNAAGISGRDGNTLQGIRMTKIVDGSPAELGLVGEVTNVDTELIESLLEEKFTPVISPLAIEHDYYQLPNSS